MQLSGPPPQHSEATGMPGTEIFSVPKHVRQLESYRHTLAVLAHAPLESLPRQKHIDCLRHVSLQRMLAQSA